MARAADKRRAAAQPFSNDANSSANRAQAGPVYTPGSKEANRSRSDVTSFNNDTGKHLLRQPQHQYEEEANNPVSKG
jgi:hypothetical protein